MSTTPVTPAPSSPQLHAHAYGALGRLRLLFGSVGAAILGAAPHVLHHAGPLAGAAIVGGADGTLLFGALGFVLAIPMLMKLGRHTGSWHAPAAALALYAVVFTLSTTVIGPALTGDSDTSPASTPTTPGQVAPADNESHHQ